MKTAREENKNKRLADREKYLNKRRAIAEKRKEEQKTIDDLKPIKPKTYTSQKSNIKYSKMWTETNNGFLEIYVNLIGLDNHKVLLFGSKDSEEFIKAWNNHKRFLKKP